MGAEIGTLPHLAYLEIYSSEQDENYGNRLRLPQNFSDLPALRGLKIASSIEVSFEAGGRLPPTLILLEFNHIRWAAFENGKKLPKGKDPTAKAMFTDCQNLRRVIITRSEQADAHILGLTPLPRLEYLRLSFSDTSGFPLALQRSPSLTTLYLSNNQSLNMSTPLDPSGFPALRQLTVIQPDVLFLDPDLQAWQRLESLYWSGPRFEELRVKVGGFPYLRNLSLHSHDLNVLPESICQVTSLQTLSLSHCQLLRLPKCLHQLNQLSSLDLQHNQFQIVPPPLQALVDLQELDLLGNPLKKLPAWLLNLPKLRLIRIPSNIDLLNDRESKEIIEALRAKGILR
jgi:Leucine-rich repeat (LRR) protein